MMQRLQTTKRHYKMYKKGRFWIVAGITVATMGLTQVVGQADTKNQISTNSTTTTVQASGAKTGNTAVLTASNATLPTNEKATSVSSSSAQSAQAQQAVSNADKQENAKTAATADTQKADAKQKVTVTDSSATPKSATKQEATVAKTATIQEVAVKQNTTATGTTATSKIGVKQDTTVAESAVTQRDAAKQDATVMATADTQKNEVKQAATATETPATQKDAVKQETTAKDGTASQESAVQQDAAASNTTTAQTVVAKQAASVAPSEAPAQSSVASEPAAVTSTAVNLKKMFRMAAPAVTSATVADDDQDISGQFSDANLLAAVRKGLQLTDSTVLTKNVIKAYGNGYGRSLNVYVAGSDGALQPVTSLKGLETLSDLAPQVAVNFTAELAPDYQAFPSFDFTPLAKINRLSGLNLYTYYWGAATDEQLKVIAGLDPERIQNLTFTTPSTKTINPYGMNNHQFAVLAPFVKAVLENQFPGTQMMGFAGNNITDFSPLKSVTPNKGSQVTGWLQYGWKTDPISYHPGETVVVNSPVTGIQGESFNYGVYYYKDDGTGNAVWALADAKQVTQTKADGTSTTVWQYTLVDPLLYNDSIVYGAPSYAQAANYRYVTNINGQASQSFSLTAGALIFQPVTSSKAAITFNPSEVVMGPTATWNYLDHLASATDYAGNAIDPSEWKNLKINNVNGGPDLTKVGPQTVAFTYTDDQNNVQNATASVTVVASRAAITAKADQIVWPKDVSKLTVADLVASVTDANGQAVTDLTPVTMTAIQADQPGPQTVTLTYKDVPGNQVTATLNVTVDLASLTTKDTQIVAGPNAKWDYLTNLTGATNSLGQAVDVKNANVQVAKEPDLTLIGQPQVVTFTYTDDLGKAQTVTANVTVVASQAAITAKDDQIVWPKDASKLTVADLVASVTDANGQAMTDMTQFSMSGIKADQPGPQTVTLSYTDTLGNQVTATLNVTVDLANLTTQDTQLIAGPNAKWDYLANLDSANDSMGQIIDVKDANVQVVVKPDLNLIGQPQSVKFTYTDDLGKFQTVTANVTVVASQATITAKDDRIVWPKDASNLTVADLVASVTDANGQPMTDMTKVTMTPIKANQAGAQTVTLAYTDAVGNQVTATLHVTVDLANLTTQDTQLIAGPNAKWDYLTNLSNATDSLGQVIDVKNANVKVVTEPDLSAALIGQPQTVVFEYTDNLGQTQRVTASVTTLKSQAMLSGQNLTIIAGPNANWTLNDSIDWQKSLAADGTRLTNANLSQITVSGRPDLQKVGVYRLTLSYVDAVGNLVTGVANVNVVASKAALAVKDSQLKVGDTWQASDNLVQATDANGQVLPVSALTVNGTVNSNVPGQYPVTYKYIDAAGNVKTQTAVITVVKPVIDPGDNGNTDNGGGTTTDPGNNGNTDNGGGTTTNPGNNGNTDNGGGTTTDPDNNGNTDNGSGTTTNPGNNDNPTPDKDGTTTNPGGHQDQDVVTVVNADTIDSTTGHKASEELVGSVGQAQPLIKTTPKAVQSVKPQSAATSADATTLPQTNEKDAGVLAILVGLLGLTGLLAAGVTRRRHEN